MSTGRVESCQLPGLRSGLSCNTQPLAPEGQETVSTPDALTDADKAGWAMKFATSAWLASEVKVKFAEVLMATPFSVQLRKT